MISNLLLIGNMVRAVWSPLRQWFFEKAGSSWFWRAMSVCAEAETNGAVPLVPSAVSNPNVAGLPLPGSGLAEKPT